MLHFFFFFFWKSPPSCWMTNIQRACPPRTCRVCAHERQRERENLHRVFFHLGVVPPPCRRHVVPATIGPCSGNILLTFGGSCPCHLETKTNGPTGLQILPLCEICALPAGLSLPCKNPTTVRLRGRKLIVVPSYVVFLFLVGCD